MSEYEKPPILLAKKRRVSFVSPEMKRREVLIFIELNLIALVILQPAAIMFANWDSPFSAGRNFTDWIIGYLGCWPLFAYYLKSKKEYFGTSILKNYMIYLISVSYLITALLVIFDMSPVYMLLFGPLYLTIGAPFFALIYLISLPYAIFGFDTIYLSSNYNGQGLGIVNLGILVVILVIYLVYLYPERTKPQYFEPPQKKVDEVS